jgi:hypothetical protein
MGGTLPSAGRADCCDGGDGGDDDEGAAGADGDGGTQRDVGIGCPEEDVHFILERFSDGCGCVLDGGYQFDDLVGGQVFYVEGGEHGFGFVGGEGCHLLTVGGDSRSLSRGGFGCDRNSRRGLLYGCRCCCSGRNSCGG